MVSDVDILLLSMLIGVTAQVAVVYCNIGVGVVVVVYCDTDVAG